MKSNFVLNFDTKFIDIGINVSKYFVTDHYNLIS